MIAVVVAVGVGEILSTLEVAGAVTAVLIALGWVSDGGSVEGAVMYPASLNGCGKGAFLLLSLHTYTVLGNVPEGNVPHLKASADACLIICGLGDEVKTPAVNSRIRADTLDGDILTTRHTSHKAVVTNASAVVYRVKLGKSCGCGNVADNSNNEGSSLLGKLTDNIRIGVCGSALGAFISANVLANRVKNITDARNGGAVLRLYGNAVFVCLGNVENDCIRLQRSVIVICADALGVIKVSIARAIVGLYRKGVGKESLVCLLCAAYRRKYLYLIISRLKSHRINTVEGGIAADKLGVDLFPIRRACRGDIGVIAVCARNGSPLGIGGLKPAGCLCNSAIYSSRAYSDSREYRKNDGESDRRREYLFF